MRRMVGSPAAGSPSSLGCANHTSPPPSVKTIYSPRVGIAIEIPCLHWVFRGFYGHFYQPPSVTSISGPLLAYARSNNTSFVPLPGERDEEHQFAVTIRFKAMGALG